MKNFDLVIEFLCGLIYAFSHYHSNGAFIIP